MSVAILGFLGNELVKCIQKQKAEELSGWVATPRPETIRRLFLRWLAQPSNHQDKPKQTRGAGNSLEVPKVSSGMSSEEQELGNDSKKQSLEHVVT